MVGAFHVCACCILSSPRWLLLDNLANDIGSTMDIAVTLTTGIAGVAFLNLTPQLAPKLSGYGDSIFNN